MNKEKTQGILLLALGHPNYGSMAANLAMSIKCNGKTNIALAYGGNALSHLDKSRLDLFDQLIEVPKKYYTNKEGFEEFIKAKVYLYELSPFDETIFLDADMISTNGKSFNDLFKELESVDFTMQNRGSKDINETFPNLYSFWMNVDDMKKAYQFTDGKYYQLASEFIYFKKAERVESLFDDAIEAYENPKLKFIKFAGGIADEAVFSIAMIQNNLYPHADNFCPIYWHQAEKKNLQSSLLNSLYYGYSLGGSHSSEKEKKVYDNYVQFFCNKSGLQNQYKAKSKASFNPDRQLI